MFHKLVDKVYAINLKSSEDRRVNILRQCHSIGTHFEIVDAVDGSSNKIEWVQNEWNSKYDGWTVGAAGLVHTTRKIVQEAKDKGYKSIMIMEDDIVFVPDAYKQAKTLFDCLPKNWDMFHLASQNFGKLPRRLGNMLRLTSAWSCQIYIISERVYDEYLEWLDLVDRPIDSITSGIIHPKGNSYAPVSDLIKTIPNYSTIRDKEMNYGIVN